MQVISDALKEDKDIIIAIGSAQRKDTKENPFDGEERKLMIEKTLAANNIPAKVFLVPNTDSDEGYVEHVEKHIGCRPNKIITENPWSIDLFSKAGYDVQVPERHFDISSTDIRENIVNNKDWTHMVPQEVADLIKEIDGIERIKRIFSDQD
jgi:nicotinamide-nucleotide adenylyltransferase